MYNVKYTINAVSYDVCIGNGAINALGSSALALVRGSNVVIVADTNTAPLYLDIATRQLTESGYTVIPCVINAGEYNKTLKTIEALYGQFYNYGVTRADGIAALGGGVVGDIAGFAAATYLRGLPFINLPTSLIAQVDSAYGGKTGIDFMLGKNYIGCFYQPSCVICDTAFLNTLPRKELLSGMGEVIKYGAIADAGLLNDIAKSGYARLSDSTILNCIDIKRFYCERDPFDKGIRHALNFGHTFGHAYEVASKYSISHGQAVLLGMLTAASLGELYGYTASGTYEIIFNAAAALGLTTDWQSRLDEAIDLIRLDKKTDGASIKMVFLKKIGEPVIMPIPIADIERMIKDERFRTP